MAILLGILISLVICFVIFSFFMDKKTLKIIFLMVIGLLVFAGIKIFFINYSKPDLLEYLKLKNPMMEIIAKKSPNDYQSYVDRIQKAKDFNEKLALTEQFLNAEFYKYAKNASGKLIYQLVQTTVDEYKVWVEKNPSLIVELEYSSGLKNKSKETMDENIVASLEKLMKLKAEVIASGIDNSQAFTPEDYDKGKALTQDIFLSLGQKYGPEKASQIYNKPDLDPTLTAVFTIDLYDSMLKTGEENTAIIFKYILSNAH